MMAVAGWSWNLLNLMAVPLILGTGVDYSIFMQLALRRHGGDLVLVRRSIGRALLLCGGTAMAGFSSLAWSSNPGMASLGQGLRRGHRRQHDHIRVFAPGLVGAVVQSPTSAGAGSKVQSPKTPGQAITAVDSPALHLNPSTLNSSFVPRRPVAAWIWPSCEFCRSGLVKGFA